MMPGLPEAQGGRRRQAATQPSTRSMREPVTLTVRYRGGSEGWWEIRARGEVHRWPGVSALHDVLREIYRA